MGALLFWGALATLVMYAQPRDNGYINIVAFYVLLMVACTCTVALVEVFFRKRLVPAPFGQLVKSSVRQAVLAGLLVIALFVLQSQHLLFWWVAGSLVLLFICIEALCNL